jgi:hypothetical protein
MIIRTKRRPYFQIIAGSCAIIIFLATQFMSCSQDLTDDPIPVVPFDEIVINLDLPAYASLHTKGVMYINDGGVDGLILYKENAASYIAFERNCSYQPFEVAAIVNIHPTNLFMEDPHCGSSFRFPDGEPNGGIAWRPLRQYATYLDGKFLTITDEILNH